MSPSTLTPGNVAGPGQQGPQLGLVESGLGGLVGQIDLDEDRQVGCRPPRPRGDSRSTQIEAVHRLDAGERARDLVGLVGLEGADQVPAEWQVGGVGPLGEGFLDAVLAEIDLAGGVGGADGVGAEGLADGDETDGLGRPSAAGRGAGDACPDGGEPPGHHGVQRVRVHSFGLIESRMPLACAAIGPVGASFR